MNERVDNPYQPTQWTVDESVSISQPSGIALAWTVIAKAWFPICLCQVIFTLPLDLIVSYCEYHIFDEDDLWSIFRLQMLLNFWFGFIAYGSVVGMTNTVLESNRASISSALGLSLRRYPHMMTMQLCWNVIFLLGLILCVLPGLYFAVRSIYALPICIAERVHGPAAISRSFELTRGRFEESFWYAASMIVAYVAAMIVYGMIAIAAWVSWSESPAMWIVDALASQSNAIAVVFATVLATCGYWRITQGGRLVKPGTVR
ncbi:MAG: glycerophosphoryl diester phosphodiesterase membrane domain-containing protein [Planctomycetota bacterium]